jgi:porphyrinogen peroxidase
MTATVTLNECRADVQAIVGSGFMTLRHCRYLMLRIDEPAPAAAWLRDVLALDLVKSLADLGREEGADFHRLDEAVLLGFSHEGLARLGVRESADFPFPTAFRSGMASEIRARLLGDRNRSAWWWEDAGAPHCSSFRVHVLLAHYRREAFPGDHDLPPPLRRSLPGLAVRSVTTCPSYIECQIAPDGATEDIAYEPFGFRDGLAQPLIADLPLPARQRRARAIAGDLFGDRLIAGGEFVLGHVNEYGERAYCPDAEGWPAVDLAAGIRSRFGVNGSYLAVRQIVQHVREFREFDDRNPAQGGEPGIAEKMVGRRRDGRPLIAEPAPPVEGDAFRFRVADFDGFQCPRGAHIRRANPRDMLGWDVDSGVKMSKLHRLLRRGRVYTDAPHACGGEPTSGCEGAGYRASCGKGLFFLALNADLDRQFELIQQRWIAHPKFNDLADQDDPLLGAAARRAFTVQGLPVGQRIEDFAPFTETVGGGYFFVPSLAALRFIAAPARLDRA